MDEWNKGKVQKVTPEDFPFWIEPKTEKVRSIAIITTKDDRDGLFYLVNPDLNFSDGDIMLTIKYPHAYDVEYDRASIFSTFIRGARFESAYGSNYYFKGFMEETKWYVDTTPFDDLKEEDKNEDGDWVGMPYIPEPVEGWERGKLRAVEIQITHLAEDDAEWLAKLRSTMEEAKAERAKKAAEQAAKRVKESEEYTSRLLADALEQGLVGDCVHCGEPVMGTRRTWGKNAGQVDVYHRLTFSRDCAVKPTRATLPS